VHTVDELGITDLGDVVAVRLVRTAPVLIFSRALFGRSIQLGEPAIDDGTAWTDHVSDRGIPSSDPMTCSGAPCKARFRPPVTALIVGTTGATLAAVIGTSAAAATRLGLLLRVVAASGAVLLAACSSGSHHTARSTKRTTASSTTVVPTTTTAAPPITYQVKRGDSLTALAQFFGVTPAVIVAANHLNGDQLTAGQVLQIPSRPPAQLVVTPPDAPIGHAFKLNLTGAKAGEIVTLEIDTPDGGKYSGSPHTTAQDGSVTATYQTASGDTAGTYTVVATGDHGTSLRATFRAEPSAPTT
jgi:LysM repeat protein